MLHNIHVITRFHVTGTPPLSPSRNDTTAQVLPYVVITCKAGQEIHCFKGMRRKFVVVTDVPRST